MKTVVIIGAGKGMGNSIAEKFAKEGFRIVLIARRKKMLDEYVSGFRQKGYEVYGETADASDMDSLERALDRILEKFIIIDVLVYNAAFMVGGKATEITSKGVIEHFKTDVVGAHLAVKKALPKMLSQKDGVILFSGGLFGVYPNANYEYACMSMDKSALRTLAQILNYELRNTGVFVGIVNIMGNVGGSENFAPEKIAEFYWKLYIERADFEIMYE